MSTPELLGLRLRAWRERRAIPSRRTFALLEDPEACLGIVPIRTSGDRRLVAAAYGHPDLPPQLLFRPFGDQDPGREPLLALLEALKGVLGEAGETGHCPRVWLPHRDALATLDLLGVRLRGQAGPLRRLGALLGALAEEEAIPGQQAIAVAGDLLASHVVTGQGPAEDAHLPSLLAWLETGPARDPADLAAERRSLPGGSGLTRAEDDRLDRTLQGRSADPLAAVDLLGAAALRGWRELQAARSAYWGLGLDPAPGREGEAASSARRLSCAAERERPPSADPLRLRRLLMEMEASRQRADAADLAMDLTERERGRRAGRVFRGRVSRPDPESGRWLRLEVRQPALRVREGGRIALLAGGISATVARRIDEPGRTELLVLVTHGVRKASGLPEGSPETWLVDAPGWSPHGEWRAERAVREAGGPSLRGLGEDGS